MVALEFRHHANPRSVRSAPALEDFIPEFSAGTSFFAVICSLRGMCTQVWTSWPQRSAWNRESRSISVRACALLAQNA